MIVLCCSCLSASHSIPLAKLSSSNPFKQGVKSVSLNLVIRQFPRELCFVCTLISLLLMAVLSQYTWVPWCCAVIAFFCAFGIGRF